MKEFKPGDEVICRRENSPVYQGMRGVILRKEPTEYRDAWEVKIYNCPIYHTDSKWIFVDEEMRHLTKLDRALK